MAKKIKEKQPFVGSYLSGEMKLGKMGLSKTAHAALYIMRGHMKWYNWITITQEQLGLELGKEQPNVCRAVKELTDNHILFLAKREGRCNTYIYHPSYGYMGPHGKIGIVWKNIADLRFVGYKK